MGSRVTSTLLGAGLCVASLAAAPVQPSLEAGDLLASDLLEGPRHRVASSVPVSGYMGRFTIESDFGDLEVTGAGLASVRIAEMDALARLRERTSADAFAEALGESAANKVRAVEQTVTDPVGTAKSIGRGVGRLFGRARRSVEERLAGDDDEAAAQSESGTGGEESSGAGEAPEVAEEDSAEEERSTADRAVGAAGGVARWYLGYNGALRRIAAGVGADPYTSNPLLREELDRLARAAVAGRRILGFFVPYIPAVSEAARLGSLSWSLSREDLRERNRESLLGMGIDEDVVRRFLAAEDGYSPTVQTALVLALEGLEGIDDRGALLGTAATAATEVEGRMYVGSLHLLAAALQAGRPLSRGRGYGRALGAELEGGGLVVAAAVDYLPWDRDVSAAAVSEEIFPRELWITGVAGAEARERLRAEGWTLREGVSVSIPWPAAADGR